MSNAHTGLLFPSDFDLHANKLFLMKLTLPSPNAVLSVDMVYFKYRCFCFGIIAPQADTSRLLSSIHQYQWKIITREKKQEGEGCGYWRLLSNAVVKRTGYLSA